MKPDSKAFWNERYRIDEFVYGELPNEYLKKILSNLQQGKILFPAEGEGRNAVFAALNNWEVYAFDQSEVAARKALALAEKHNVTIQYDVKDMEQIAYPANSMDAIALIYAHFPNVVRRRFHQQLATCLKSGGILILEAFTKEHIQNQKHNPNAGGPKNVDMLYDIDDLATDFEGFDFKTLKDEKIQLNEGKHHLGQADVIRIFAIKK